VTKIDVLVVGGGPAGTAAAFRARELGLEPLVIDYDDLMKRIRDYSKDKLILPSFGGGDALCFPKGDDLISGLHFTPIDKDEMCACWKGLYEEHGVPTRIGVELTGLEAVDGGWRAVVWNHTSQCEEAVETRAVVVAVGRGVPRHFDIPGNTEGIAFRLSDPSGYVGEPACVVGGGTSAAEAVIAISNAKAAAGDATAVYWSYRGDRMPRISKALAEVFFEAYVGNGNIRYFPKSEPAAVLTGDDRQDYLAVRVDRRRMDDRPSETVHLEFPKGACLACIGEDLPEKLLDAIGSPLVTGGPKGKRRVVVSPHLETRQPGVYLAGDLLSQAYLETEDFEADPAGFREVKHRGNVKSELRDGVLVAEVMKQRLDGKTEIDARVEDADDPVAVAGGSPLASLSQPAARGGPPAASADPARAATEEGAVLIHLLPTGVEENEYSVREHGVTSFGSGECDVSFPNDSMMSGSHGSISHGEEGFLLRDDGCSTGVFLQLSPARKRALVDGDLIRVGRQFLRISCNGEDASFTHYDASGAEVGRHQLGEKPMVVGREAPGASLDAEDQSLSRRHLAISLERGQVVVKDLKSLNGSYLRVRTAVELEHGDRFRAGQQLFVFSLDPGAVLDAGKPEPAAAPAPAGGGGQADTSLEGAADSAAEGPAVTFKGTGQTLVLSEGETVCTLAERCGVAINAECHSGICGSDPVRIVSGRENVVGEPSDQERETLEDLCEVEPGEYRLACLLRVSGPVEVEIL
jgi:thioredoxin reductase/pSer/pThr/pTyr-binding forkhead associated (FHA) protein/ferredoxin